LATLPKSGRPPKFSKEVADLVKEEINNSIQQKEIVKDLSAKMDVDIDISTLSRHLPSLGQYKFPILVPIISPKNKQTMRYRILSANSLLQFF